MRHRVEVDIAPAYWGTGIELSVRVMNSQGAYSLIKNYPEDLVRSHFDIVWKHIGEELKAGIAADTRKDKSLGTYQMGVGNAPPAEVPPAQGDVAPDAV